MAAGILNLPLEQGATLRKNLIWSTGAPAVLVDLTGYAARMQLRAAPGATAVLVSLTDVAGTAGQLILGGAAGTIQIYINAATTATLSGGGVYDLELVAPNGDVTRLVQGSFSVSPNVTV